jgi:hypothetical protein
LILTLTFDEIDVLLRAIQLKRENYQLTDQDHDIVLLDGLEDRLEAVCHQSAEPVATAWQVEVKNEKGRRKHWFRSVEVRVFSEMLYVFRVRAEDLFKPNDPITDHYIVIGNREYRTTQPAPAEVHLKALVAFRGVFAWMTDAGITEETVRKDWPT